MGFVGYKGFAGWIGDQFIGAIADPLNLIGQILQIP